MGKKGHRGRTEDCEGRQEGRKVTKEGCEGRKEGRKVVKERKKVTKEGHEGGKEERKKGRKDGRKEGWMEGSLAVDHELSDGECPVVMVSSDAVVVRNSGQVVVMKSNAQRRNVVFPWINVKIMKRVRFVMQTNF